MVRLRPCGCQAPAQAVIRAVGISATFGAPDAGRPHLGKPHSGRRWCPAARRGPGISAGARQCAPLGRSSAGWQLARTTCLSATHQEARRPEVQAARRRRAKVRRDAGERQGCGEGERDEPGRGAEDPGRGPGRQLGASAQGAAGSPCAGAQRDSARDTHEALPLPAAPPRAPELALRTPWAVSVRTRGVLAQTT